MSKYRLKKGNIIKSNFEAEYEPKAFTEELRKQEIALKEAIAQKGIYEAERDNIARHNKFVTKMSDERRNAVWMYQERLVASIQVSESIKALKKNVAGLKKEMREITKQTGEKFE